MGKWRKRMRYLLCKLVVRLIFFFFFMKHSPIFSFVRIAIIGIFIGMILQISSSWMTSAAYPVNGIGGTSPKWALFTQYFQNLLEDTNIATTDGKVKNTDTLWWAAANLYQRRVNSTCNVDYPIVGINPDGSTSCSTIYRWNAPTWTGWSSCIPKNNYCGTTATSGSQTGTVTCTDNLGNIFPDAKCEAAVPALVKPSNIRDCNPGISCDCNVAPWGIIPNGATRTAYSASSANTPTTCATLIQTRTCTNTILSGTHAFSSCTNTGPYSYWAWSPCSVSCGGGTQSRIQSCSYDSCHTPQATSQNCNTAACPVINGACNPAYNGGSFPGPYTWASVSASVCNSGSPVEGSGFPNGPWTWQCVWSGGGGTASCSANKSLPPLAMCWYTTNSCTNGGALKPWSNYTWGNRYNVDWESHIWKCSRAGYADDNCINWPFCYSGPTTPIPCP